MPDSTSLADPSAGSRAEKAEVAAATKAGRSRHDPLVRALGGLSEIADQRPSFIACGTVLAVGLASRRPRLAEAGAVMLASVLVAAAMKSVVKNLVSRTRPHAVLDGQTYAFEIGSHDDASEQSFPSGHTAGAVAMARGLARVYPAAGPAAYVGAAAIACVQVPRAKHYPTDLLAGAAIGVAAEAIVAVAGSAMTRRYTVRVVTTDEERR